MTTANQLNETNLSGSNASRSMRSTISCHSIGNGTNRPSNNNNSAINSGSSSSHQACKYADLFYMS